MTKIDVNQENSSKQPHEASKSNIGKNHQSSIEIQPRYKTKSHKNGSLLVRGGLIGAIISSALTTYSSLYSSNIYYAYFGLIVGGVGLFLFAVIFYLGVIITLYNLIQTKQINTQFTQFVTNKQTLAVISIIVVNWALSPIPQTFLFPFFGQIIYFGGKSSFALPLDAGKELEQHLLIEIVQGILTHPDLESGLIGRLIRLVAIGLLIYTIFYLIWTLIKLTKDFKDIKGKTNLNAIFLEFCFSIGILILLIFEIVRQIWAYTDPYGFGRIWWSSLLLTYDITIPLSIFFLLFLITGNFENRYIVMGYADKNKSRALLSISITLIIVGYSCLPLLW